jgi:hypothetical protein
VPPPTIYCGLAFIAAGWVNFAEGYNYSFPKLSEQAAKFYTDGIDGFDMITRYSGN